jgi:hypothetical protein
MELRLVKLEDGANFAYLTSGLNQQDENSAIQVYLQVRDSCRRLIHMDTQLPEGMEETQNGFCQALVVNTIQDAAHVM